MKKPEISASLWPPKDLIFDLRYIYLHDNTQDMNHLEDKLLEEMGELTQAIIKNRHHRGGKYTKEELLQHYMEELSHVQIRLSNLVNHLAIQNSDNQVLLRKEYQTKLDKLFRDKQDTKVTKGYKSYKGLPSKPK